MSFSYLLIFFIFSKRDCKFNPFAVKYKIFSCLKFYEVKSSLFPVARVSVLRLYANLVHDMPICSAMEGR